MRKLCLRLPVSRQGKEYQIIMEKTEIPVIDVIIPAYRPDDSFHKLIRLLLEQSVKPHHIYVLQTIEDGEQVMEPLDQRMTVHAIPKREFDHGATRDYGARLAGEGFGEKIPQHYLLFMTQDAVPAGTDLLERLVKPFMMTGLRSPMPDSWREKALICWNASPGFIIIRRRIR